VVTEFLVSCRNKIDKIMLRNLNKNADMSSKK